MYEKPTCTEVSAERTNAAHKVYGNNLNPSLQYSRVLKEANVLAESSW